MLCRFRQSRNSSVLIPFIDFSTTTTISATSENGTIPERIGESEEPNSRNEEQTGKNLGSTQNCEQMKRSKVTWNFKTWNLDFYYFIFI